MGASITTTMNAAGTAARREPTHLDSSGQGD